MFEPKIIFVTKAIKCNETTINSFSEIMRYIKEAFPTDEAS